MPKSRPKGRLFFVQSPCSVVNMPTSREMSKPKDRTLTETPSLKTTLLLFAVAAVLLFEVLYLSQRYDAYILVMDSRGVGWRWLFGYAGAMAKVAVLFVAVLLLLLKSRLIPYGHSLALRWQASHRLPWLVLQGGAFALLLWATHQLYEVGRELAAQPIWLFPLWGGAVLVTLLSWAFALAQPQWWWQHLRAEWAQVAVALAVALSVWALARLTQNFWGPMSDLTFLLSALLLSAINYDALYLDIEAKLLGLGDFVVNVAPACSGYEGIGLISAFTAVYLYLYRHEFRFPRALLLFPLGAVLIWLLNVVRIAVLVSIGHYWSPEVAVGGFHSQAGWLTFILVSISILWLARHARWLTVARAPRHAAPTMPMNLAIATLLPLVVLLASMLLTSAFSAGFSYLYPLRVVVTALALWYCWRWLALRPYRPRLIAVSAGVLVCILWIVLVPRDAQLDADHESAFAAMGPLWASLWLLFRFVGTAVTVPLAEELAFRGYLLCRAGGAEVQLKGRLPFSVLAIAVSSLAFGALHGAWIAGTAAGVIYALVRLRSEHLGDAILAHALTNALLFVYAFTMGAWSLL